jgi:hypothetical protein
MPFSSQKLTSKKRQGDTESLPQEVHFIQKRSRRGGYSFEAVAVQATSPLPSSTSKLQASSSTILPSVHVHGVSDSLTQENEQEMGNDSNQYDDNPKTPRARRYPGQVPRLSLVLSLHGCVDSVFQTGNDVLDDWLPHRNEYLSVLLENEGPQSLKCNNCNLDNPMYRCAHCFGHPQLCQSCVLQSHIHSPFHFIERWTGNFFQPIKLIDIGFIIHLGHCGQPCPANKDLQCPDLVICVVDTLGITHHRFQECRCPHARPLHIQLLQMELFPSTIERPQTVFSFSVLNRFHIESLEGKVAANNFYNQLRRLSDGCFPQSLPVCSLLHSSHAHTSS